MALRLAVAEGMDRRTLVEAAGLGDVDLSDLDARLPLSIHVALLHLVQKGVSEPGFGVRAGASLDVRETGLLGYLLSYSATLGDALHRLARYSRVLTEEFVITIDTSDSKHVAIGVTHEVMGTEVTFAIDFRVAAIVGACRQITGVRVVPAYVAFPYSQPASTLQHRRFLQCELRFRQPATRIVLHRRDFDLRVARGNDDLAGYLSGYADHVLSSLVSGTLLRERVRSAIWSAMGDGRPTLSRIASSVGLPERTLQRRLALEGTSVHEEIEEVRKSMAIATLRDQRMSVEEVAFLLGYTEPSTFFRSFRRWTGTTPQQYRRTMIVPDPAPDASRVARDAMTTATRGGDVSGLG